MLKFVIHFVTYLDNVIISRSGYQDTDGPCSIEEEFVTGRFFVSFFNTGNVA